MVDHDQTRAIAEIMEVLNDEGPDGFGRALTVLLNTAMKLEREKFMGAAAYERTAERRAHANGFKPKTVKTRVGELDVSIPQVREGGFYPSALDKGMRSERALKLALAEMYVQGVSTRKIARVTEELCGFEVSSSDVSRASAELDELLTAWRNRPLGDTPYVWLDARYEKIRHGGVVVDCAVLIAKGVRADGKRTLLGVSVSLSEAEVHWRDFLASLKQRGLSGVRLIISDAHEGLKNARKAVFHGIPWQRCQFHLQRNAAAYVSRKDMKRDVASDIRDIFNAKNREKATQLLDEAIEAYQDNAPKLATWMQDNLPQGFTAFDFPSAHRIRLRTTNPLERLNREIKRRTDVATLFPNEASCLRLVSALLMELSEDWETNENTYMKINS